MIGVSEAEYCFREGRGRVWGWRGLKADGMSGLAGWGWEEERG
jgi:hypothetical protein